MGTTLTTLNVYNAERSSVIPALAPSDQLRDQNSPWLTVVPSHDTGEDAFQRLSKVARQLTKDSNTVALLFYYFDDDMFRCSFYQNGKKSASCDNNQSWTKLGKKISECFGNDSPSKAFRYASHCFNLEEQLKLLEETIGTALYDLQEEEPRIVKQCDTTLREIKARETMLRKRPNSFILTELPLSDWPNEQKYRQKLLKMLRPHWREYHLSSLLYETDMKRYIVPNAKEIIAYPYKIDWNEGLDNLILMNGQTGECWEQKSFSGTVCRTMWQTKAGGMVFLIACTVLSNTEKEEGPRIQAHYSVICLNRDGSEQWRFEPEMNRHQSIQFIHSSECGVITLFASGIDAIIKADTLIWQIDGETGELLHTYSYPYKDDVHHIIHVDSINAFLFCRRSAHELVVLNESMDEKQCIEGYNGSYYFKEDQLFGSILWEGDIWNNRYMSFYDLQSGESRKTTLEIPAYPILVLPDGRILGINEKLNKMTVFDKEGIVVARCSVPGMICRAFLENGNVYLVEVRGPDTHGLVYGALFDETSTHVWRLDPILAD